MKWKNALAVTSLCLLLAACGTVAPEPVHSRLPSPSGSELNSGYHGVEDGKYFKVDERWLKEDAFLRILYYDKFTPPIEIKKTFPKSKKDPRWWLVNLEENTHHLAMRRWRTENVDPVSGWARARERFGF